MVVKYLGEFFFNLKRIRPRYINNLNALTDGQIKMSYINTQWNYYSAMRKKFCHL